MSAWSATARSVEDCTTQAGLDKCPTSLQDLRFPPGNRLESLKGDRKGQHNVRINDRYRISFHQLQQVLGGRLSDIDLHDWRLAAQQFDNGAASVSTDLPDHPMLHVRPSIGRSRHAEQRVFTGSDVHFNERFHFRRDRCNAASAFR